MQNKIVMYGTTWCTDCTRAKSFFAARGIEYEWINIDEDHGAAELVIQLNSGKRIVPTIIFPDGSILAEPSNTELAKKMEASKPNHEFKEPQ